MAASEALGPHDFVALGSLAHAGFALLLAFARGADLLSTWIATPTLALAANPVARRLGWRGGVAFSLAGCVLLGLWPLLAVAIATTSLLVAAHNLDSAWLMRLYGETGYRLWRSETFRNGRRGEFVLLLATRMGLFALLGAGLMLFSGLRLVPFAAGLGVVTYAIAVVFYTLLALRRMRRAEPAADPPPGLAGTPSREPGL
ncbi:MAG TPA: hypothetical protein PKE47_17695 [Verrucomicrobiota bacterium]|nr:hypothetical protein [Verrucomicrobiota bacterium]